jgi:hypothetical protein
LAKPARSALSSASPLAFSEIDTAR